MVITTHRMKLITIPTFDTSASLKVMISDGVFVFKLCFWTPIDFFDKKLHSVSAGVDSILIYL